MREIKRDKLLILDEFSLIPARSDREMLLSADREIEAQRIKQLAEVDFGQHCPKRERVRSNQ